MVPVSRPQGFSAGGAYNLDEDIDGGFHLAVQNSQTTLALQYLRLIVERDQAKIAALEAQLEGLQQAKPSTSSSTTKKSSSAKKEDASA